MSGSPADHPPHLGGELAVERLEPDDVVGERRLRPRQAPWHFLNFLPEPHGQRSFRPTFSKLAFTFGFGATGVATPPPPGEAGAAVEVPPRREDRVGAGERLVLVAEAPFRAVVGLLELLALLGGHLGMEEKRHDLFVDRSDQVLEHDRALVAVLDERVLLREPAQADAFAHVVHRLEVLAPARRRRSAAR